MITTNYKPAEGYYALIVSESELIEKESTRIYEIHICMPQHTFKLKAWSIKKTLPELDFKYNDKSSYLIINSFNWEIIDRFLKLRVYM